MSGWQLRFRVPADRCDAVEAALDAAFAGLLAPPALSRCECTDARLWEFTVYFTEHPEAHLRATIGARLADVLDAPPERLQAVPIEDRDWVSESQKLLAPVRAGRFFIHGSHDRRRRPLAGIALEIEAGQAFGTGQHATTRGCLLLIDELLRRRPPPRRILDLGCGSGILALALARAGGRPVIASDIDPVAIAVARMTARRNAVPVKAAAGQPGGPGIVPVVASGLAHRRLRTAAPFGLVVANILAGPLLAMATPLAAALAPGGRLVLSGLLRSQEARIRAVYRARGLVLERRHVEEGWTSLVLRKGWRQRDLRNSRSSGAATTIT